TVEVPGLPAGLSENSVRAEIEGPARVVSVTSYTRLQAKSTDKTLAGLEDEAAELDHQLNLVGGRLDVMTREKQLVDTLQGVAGAAVGRRVLEGTVDVKVLGEITAFLDQRTTRIAEDRDKLQQQRRELQEKQADLARRIEVLRTGTDKQVRVVRLALVARRAGEATLRVSYLVGGASWRPRYEARYRGGKLTVGYLAQLRQQTGEAWDDVDVTLSTARPALGSARPKLTPLRLALAEKPDAQTGVATVRRNDAPADLPPSPGDTLNTATGGSTDAAVDRDGVSVVFRVPGKVTLDADGRMKTLRIMSFVDDRPVVGYEAVPRRRPFVYQRCDTRNATEYPLLPGPVDIYRQGAFVGTAGIGHVAAGRPFSLSLGIDDQLKLTRRLLKQRRRPETGPSWHRRLEVYETVIENFKAEPVSVTVKDWYPLSDLDEVRVTLADDTTRPDRHDREKGHLAWDVVAAPEGGKAVVVSGYEVEKPEDMAWQP
ncbi:MAG: mucoidy inhibitor MuiA family protein, partial [Planctomycetota bacterium]